MTPDLLELRDDGMAERLLLEALGIVQHRGARREEAQLWNEFGRAVPPRR